MAFKAMVSVLTAQNATETNKTLIDTVTVPQGVKALIGVGWQPISGMAGMTTLENIGGILEVESDDMSPWGGTQAFISGIGAQLTSGAYYAQPYIHPTNIPVIPGAKLKLSTTYDLALTVNPKVRVQLYFE
jgi:hypothetical protein